jgi:hypothetical protein
MMFGMCCFQKNKGDEMATRIFVAEKPALQQIQDACTLERKREAVRRAQRRMREIDLELDQVESFLSRAGDESRQYASAVYLDGEVIKRNRQKKKSLKQERAELKRTVSRFQADEAKRRQRELKVQADTLPKKFDSLTELARSKRELIAKVLELAELLDTDLETDLRQVLRITSRVADLKTQARYLREQGQEVPDLSPDEITKGLLKAVEKIIGRRVTGIKKRNLKLRRVEAEQKARDTAKTKQLVRN